MSYLGFGSKKPSYKKSSKYGGFRLDIDEYYKKKENQKKLKDINNSDFPKAIKKGQKRSTTSAA